MHKIKKVVITGPECTGKTTLTKQLAQHFNTVFIPEYARDYAGKLNRPYTYNDIEHIANMQVTLENEYISKANRYLFYDTYLIITKIWFTWSFNKYPLWLDQQIQNNNIDLFLLLDTDIRWEPDSVRENPGVNRKKLFMEYQSELAFFKKNYEIITGTGNVRFENALAVLQKNGITLP